MFINDLIIIAQIVHLLCQYIIYACLCLWVQVPNEPR